MGHIRRRRGIPPSAMGVPEHIGAVLQSIADKGCVEGIPRTGATTARRLTSGRESACRVENKREQQPPHSAYLARFVHSEKRVKVT